MELRVRECFPLLGRRLFPLFFSGLADGGCAESGKASLVSKEKRHKAKKKKTKGPPPTAGADWFNVPNTPLTPELEQTFKVLELRPYMSKDHHYKRSGKGSEIPEFFGVGTVVDDPLDFYSSRVLKKHRKQSLADELLDDEQVQKYVKRKAGAIKAKADRLSEIRHR